jgi:hypothetical protein
MSLIFPLAVTTPKLIWNRACGGGGPNPCKADCALAALLKAHGLIMNGGVLHAVGCLSASELADAESGYRFFRFDAAAYLLSRARIIREASQDLESYEQQLDRDYAALIPDDLHIPFTLVIFCCFYYLPVSLGFVQNHLLH